jgi:hypothetical protein
VTDQKESSHQRSRSTVAFSFGRRRSRSGLTVASPDLGVEVDFDGDVLREIREQRLWPAASEVVDGAVRLWGDDGSVSFVASAPRRFVSWLGGRAATETDRWEVSRRRIGESELEAHVPLAALARCVQLSLHQWRRKGGVTTCAVCSAAWERLANDSRLGSSLLGMTIAAPLKGRDRRDYETFEKHRKEVRDDHLRVVLHSSRLAAARDDELAALRYVVVLGTSHFDPRVRLLRTTGAGFPAGQVPSVEVFEQTDPDERALVEMRLPQPAPLASIELFERDAFDDLRKSYEDDGAQALAVGARWGHLTVTLDPKLLEGEGRVVADAACVTPLEAARLLALQARFFAKMPPAPYGTLSLRPRHYYDARPYVQIPGLRALYALVRGLDDAKKEQCLNLYSSTHERLSLLARAEDEIGFRYFFGFARPIEDELLYHFEFLVLTAQALLEGLRSLTAILNDVPPRTAWDKLMDQVDNQLLSSFISGNGNPLLRLVGVLRNPTAHEIRWETWHGVDTPLVRLEGEQAKPAAECLVEMNEPPLYWGIQDHPVNVEGVELAFQPYPFAVSLTARLYWFTRYYLEALRAGIDLSDLSAPPPWAMTNPQLDEPSHRLIKLLSWPLPSSSSDVR